MRRPALAGLDYDWSRSTKENHTLQGCRSFGGEFASIREALDPDYHGCYSARRTRLQDQIILDAVSGGVVSDHPWIIFTAGAMGAGKGHTIKWMGEQGHLPLDELVQIDPDVFRARLPEWPMYSQRDPETAGRLTQRESGYCVEVAQEVALQQSKSIWVDGSLHDSNWYSQVFAHIRRKYPQYRIAIIHVYAPWDVVVSRAADRSRVTGRLVPQDTLRQSFASVPQAVERLSGLADVTAHVENADVPRLVRVSCGGRSQPGLMRVGLEAFRPEMERCSFLRRVHPGALRALLDMASRCCAATCPSRTATAASAGRQGRRSWPKRVRVPARRSSICPPRTAAKSRASTI
jgi:hypothetical protein